MFNGQCPPNLTSQPQSTNIRHPTHRSFAERNGLTNGCFRFRRTPLGLGAFTGKPNFGNNPTAHHLFCGNSSSLFYVCTVVVCTVQDDPGMFSNSYSVD
jgi:hypothetical protein